MTTHHGDVHLRLPPKANFQYQVVTRHGDISTDFENMRAENHTGTSTATGTVGKGGVKMSVTSDTGDIEISKADGSRLTGDYAGASGETGESRASQEKRWATSR